MSIRTRSPLHRLVSFFVTPSVGAGAFRATLAVRGAVGFVFLTSGIVKFLFANQGPGCFVKIGLPSPAELAYFVGSVEIVCGTLLLVGLRPHLPG